MQDIPGRLHSPAAERNRGPILAALQGLLPAQGQALEIAAGTGQHAAWFASSLAGWTWWPTDPEAASCASIDAWCAGLPNVRPARLLDVLQPAWAGGPAQVDLVYCANMLHIAPWATCAALMHGAARHLAPTGLLVTYGPYAVDGETLADGNRAFDADLRQRNPAWGLRRLQDVQGVAADAGLRLHHRADLPANNLLLAWVRDAPAAR